MQAEKILFFLNVKGSLESEQAGKAGQENMNHLFRFSFAAHQHQKLLAFHSENFMTSSHKICKKKETRDSPTISTTINIMQRMLAIINFLLKVFRGAAKKEETEEKKRY